ncbi:hypothetical protein [uncultured Kordia sp.]|uniref:hypothetical protein n=1 Tax=uncultured Kordia sp. TaxID=507699 RepID=UPI002637267E|nr:hypothetical protein [uncultured Kordia sp.]
MLRLLKILLTIASIILIGMILYVFFYEIIGRPNSNAPLEAFIYLSLGFITATINIVYHIVSFQYSRRKENVNLNKKLPKVLWVGAICFSSFVLYVTGAGLYSVIRYVRYNVDLKQILFVLFFLGTALCSFLELFLLKKRIKKLKKEHETKNDIETIGLNL